MTSQNSSSTPEHSLLCAVLKDEKVALVRILGRGNFSNSLTFKNFTRAIGRKHPDFRLVVDMSQCESMDSTFMGVLAGVALSVKRDQGVKLTLVNTSDHCLRLLRNLGVIGLLEICNGTMENLKEAEKQLSPGREVEASRKDQLLLTLKAHKQLVMIDDQNELRFQAVIEYLEESLAEEQEKDSSDGNSPH